MVEYENMNQVTFEVTENALPKISADALIVFAFRGKESFEATQKLEEVDRELSGKLSAALKADDFSGKENSLFKFFADGIASPRVIVLGLGKKDEFIAGTLRKAIAHFTKRVTTLTSASLSPLSDSDVPLPLKAQTHMVVEGVLLGGYKFLHYKKSSGKKLESIILSADKSYHEKMKQAISKAELYSSATILARDLVNEQPTVATPTYLAKVAQDIAKAHPEISCKVYDKAECEKMGMEAFLGIARAADTPPKFIYLHYKPGKPSKRKLAIVGKGITFDSGGINVKPGDHMQTMKIDMSGAAAVLGVFSVIAKLTCDFEVIGLIASTPNLISGRSIVPGDVVRAMNGKTIEILNTDAEGRVTMADSLSFAVAEGATKIIDLATLTGACEVALGTDIAGLFSNSHDLTEKIKVAAFEAGEEAWELPLPKYYKGLNKSSVADIANIPSTRWGGAITAALFLEEFVNEKAWAHLDIAGPAYAEREFALGPKGATGYGVRMLLNLISNDKFQMSNIK